MEAINTQGLRILRLFGNTEAQKVFPSVGPEQEYFLVDREKYLKRRDLIYTGRTLFGAPAPKGQELVDQYFGVIRDRVGSFMSDLNEELWKTGHPRHHPAQRGGPRPARDGPHLHHVQPGRGPESADHGDYEAGWPPATGWCACSTRSPTPESTARASTTTGPSAPTPGRTCWTPATPPTRTSSSCLVLSCIMKAVDTHADLLRQSASCVGNEHRLGGQEALPPSSPSSWGTSWESVVDQIVSNAESVKLLASASWTPACPPSPC